LFFRMNDLGQERIDFFDKMFDLGDFIQAEGVMFRTRHRGGDTACPRLPAAGEAVSPLPAAKDEVMESGETVRHAALEDPELRARQRYADLAVNPEVRETFRKRAGIIRSLREFLDDHGFLEVETPSCNPSTAEQQPDRSPRITISSSRICSCGFPSNST